MNALLLLLSVAFAADLGAIEGRNLNGEDVTFASMVSGERTLLVMPFERDQNEDMHSWYEPGERLGLRLAIAPVLPRSARVLRGLIDRGMAKGLSEARRARTATFYVDKDPLKEHLGLVAEDELALLLLDGAGAVLWRGVGAWSAATEGDLRAVLTPAAPSAGPPPAAPPPAAPPG